MPRLVPINEFGRTRPGGRRANGAPLATAVVVAAVVARARRDRSTIRVEGVQRCGDGSDAQAELQAEAHVHDEKRHDGGAEVRVLWY